jgi:hypothetical protein
MLYDSMRRYLGCALPSMRTRSTSMSLRLAAPAPTCNSGGVSEGVARKFPRSGIPTTTVEMARPIVSARIGVAKNANSPANAPDANTVRSA